MPQYFVSEKLQLEQITKITGSDFLHLIQVRRVGVGDLLLVRDQNNILYEAKVVSLVEKELSVKILKKINRKSENIHLEVGLSLLKGKNFDLALQKVVEVGVSSIVPLKTERTIPKIEENKISSKENRWLKILQEAAKQSLRQQVPELKNYSSLGCYLKECQAQLKIIAHPDPELVSFKEVLSENCEINDVALLIGPEGGFSEKEIEDALANNWQCLNFSTSQLRAETAAIVLPALVLYELNN